MKAETIDIEDNDGIQRIEIPGDFKINDNKAYIKKIGDVIYIIPYHSPWKSMYDSLDGFTPDFMEERHQPRQEERESFD